MSIGKTPDKTLADRQTNSADPLHSIKSSLPQLRGNSTADETDEPATQGQLLNKDLPEQGDDQFVPAAKTTKLLTDAKIDSGNGERTVSSETVAKKAKTRPDGKTDEGNRARTKSSETAARKTKTLPGAPRVEVNRARTESSETAAKKRSVPVAKTFEVDRARAQSRERQSHSQD